MANKEIDALLDGQERAVKLGHYVDSPPFHTVKYWESEYCYFTGLTPQRLRALLSDDKRRALFCERFELLLCKAMKLKDSDFERETELYKAMKRGSAGYKELVNAYVGK